LLLKYKVLLNSKYYINPSPGGYPIASTDLGEIKRIVGPLEQYLQPDIHPSGDGRASEADGHINIARHLAPSRYRRLGNGTTEAFGRFHDFFRAAGIEHEEKLFPAVTPQVVT
jgi:hypothetical protein